MSPASFRHYGIAYGDGIVNNLRRSPWKVLALPLFLASFAAAARRAARGADLVHAHWLPCAVPALATGKPIVLQLWGSDVALARRVRPLARWLVRRAQVVVCASSRARRGRSRARRARRPRDPERGRDPGVGRRAGRTAARAVRRAALGGEGRAGAGRGGAGPAPRRGRGRAAPLAVPTGGRLRRRRTSSARGTSALRSSSSPRAGRATGWSPARRWRTDGRWWPRRSAASSTRSRTAMTGLLVPAGDVAALRSAIERLLGDADLRQQARGERGCKRSAPILSRERCRKDARGIRARDRARARQASAAAHERLQHTQAVEGRQLLALLARAGRVGDRHLVDPLSRKQHARRDLRLDPEAALAEAQRAEQLRAHRLVARHHVRDPAVVDHVRRKRDRLVAHHVPEAERGVTRPRACAEHDVRVAVEQRLQERCEVGRAVLEVGVEDRRELAGRVLEGRLKGCPLPAIPVVHDERHVLRPVSAPGGAPACRP